jgi:hypothetical protein
MDNEDKLAWCEKYGEQTENEFCVSRLYELDVLGYLNPEKKHNKYVHDLFLVLKADLKTVRTPLFKAQELYDIDPQYAVTFNLKDANRYKELYPNIVVVFDVMWDKESCSMDIGGRTYSVEPMHKTFAGLLGNVKNAIIASGSKKITYRNRINDSAGNAKESYVFDVRNLHLIKGENVS